MYLNDHRFLQVHLDALRAKIRGKPPHCDSEHAEDRSLPAIAVALMPLVAVVLVVVALMLWRSG
jgi:hypothetical protein